jgi:hypothetical protein
MLEAMLATDDYTHYSIDEHPVRPARGEVWPAPGGPAGRGTIVEVTDGDGEKRSVVRMPYRFSDADSGPVRGVPEPGEHAEDILRDWTGQPDLPRVVPPAPPHATPRSPPESLTASRCTHKVGALQLVSPRRGTW